MVLRYYEKIGDATIYELSRQVIFNNEKKLMVFSVSIWQDFPYTGISTVSYILFYQGGQIGHFTHVPGPVDQYSAESEYNV